MRASAQKLPACPPIVIPERQTGATVESCPFYRELEQSFNFNRLRPSLDFGPIRKQVSRGGIVPKPELPYRDTCMKKKNELGALVRRQRESFRLTQRELAHKLGVKASHVAYIEGGLRRPSLALVRRLADTLGINKQKLLLLTYPEARFLISQPTEPSHDPAAAWQQFAGDRAMLSQHAITEDELEVLHQVSMLGRVRSPRNLLFVLNAIRQAVAED